MKITKIPIRHTSGDGSHHVPRLLQVEEYASDRCITGSTPHYILPLELLQVEEYASDRCIPGTTPHYILALEFIRNRS